MLKRWVLRENVDRYSCFYNLQKGASSKGSSVLKHDNAVRQIEEWYLHIFQAKVVEAYDVPQEKLSLLRVSRTPLSLGYVFLLMLLRSLWCILSLGVL